MCGMLNLQVICLSAKTWKKIYMSQRIDSPEIIAQIKEGDIIFQPYPASPKFVIQTIDHGMLVAESMSANRNVLKLFHTEHLITEGWFLAKKAQADE
jgi:hypothetical protein